MLAILFLIFTTSAGLFYLYSEDGPLFGEENRANKSTESIVK
jgi:hypothetical protein